MADDNNSANPEQGRKPILKIIVVVVLFVIAIAGSIGATLLLTGALGKKPVATAEDAGGPAEADREKSSSDAAEASGGAHGKGAGVASEAAGEGKAGKDAGKSALPQKKPLPANAQARFEKSYMDLDEKKPLVANVAGSRKVMQVSIALMTQYDDRVFKNVERHRAALRSAALDVLRQVTEQDLGKLDFRAELAIRLRERINRELERLENFGGIEEVFFTEFVHQ